jgi:chorismate synthase
VPIDAATINHDLARRMQGYGRGGRMKIEQDQAEIRSGVRWGESLGSPITLWIENRDWRNWEKKMSPHAADRDPSISVTRPRPGHADLAGALKYNHRDVRNILERASARETAARVAVGGLAKALLAPFGIRVLGWVAEIGGIAANHVSLTAEEVFARAEQSPVRMADADAEGRIIARIDECKKAGDTLGGVVETVATGLPPGLGSHAQWDRKLDGRLAHALMSVQAAKGVEVGLGFETARRPGSAVHDEIYFDEGLRRFVRRTNNAGGTEGGMSSGEPIVVRTAFKPLSTLMSPLHSVDIDTKDEAKAAIERSDVVAIPAAAVIAESVVAFVIADAFLEKFGGDSITELERNYRSYMESIAQ